MAADLMDGTEIARITKGKDILILAVKEFQGKKCFDQRIYFELKGKLIPTKRGIRYYPETFSMLFTWLETAQDIINGKEPF